MVFSSPNSFQILPSSLPSKLHILFLFKQTKMEFDLDYPFLLMGPALKSGWYVQ